LRVLAGNKMKKKSILIFTGGSVLPVNGMHQVRILNQIKSLANDHIVDFCFLYTKKSQIKSNKLGLSEYCRMVIPIKTITQSLIYRIFSRFFLKKILQWLAFPHDYFTLSNLFTSKIIAGKINSRKYDLIISHYWQASGFLRFVNGSCLKVIDTHYMVEENISLFNNGHYNHINDKRLGKLLQRELKLQKKYFEISDLLVVNSDAQISILKQKGYSTEAICIPNGQQLDDFLSLKIPAKHHELNLLFYGSLQNQFNQKALIRLLDKIYPCIIQSNPSIKLIILGANPPEWLYRQTKNNPKIMITGFMADVREVFKKCFACILPLESASGFRGRVVEILASGVPIIGTENALKSVNISHGINGIIAESDEELCSWVLKISSDNALRIRIAKEGRNHAIQNYTLEATHNKLNLYLKNLSPKNE